MRATPLAKKVGFSPPKAKVLRDHLKIDEDSTCSHLFEFGPSKFMCFSDNAVRKMTDALAEVDMAALWAARSK